MAKELVALCVDSVRGNVKNFSKEEQNEAIRQGFISLLGTDKLDYKTFRRNKVAIFEIIETTLSQLIQAGWERNPFFQQFVDFRNLELGDKNEFEVEDKTMLLVSEFSGDHWNIRRQKLDIGDVYQIDTKWFGVSIYADFARVLSGRLDWVAFVGKVGQAFENAIKEQIYATFMGALAKLPTEFKVSGSYSVANLRTMIQHVEASTGKVPMIAGTRTALANVIGSVTSGWVSETMKDQLNEGGMIASFEGIPVMPIPQVHKVNKFDFAIDNNRLLVVPADAKPVKFVYEGDARIMDNNDGQGNADQSVEYNFQLKYGSGIVFEEMFGLYNITG